MCTFFPWALTWEFSKMNIWHNSKAMQISYWHILWKKQNLCIPKIFISYNVHCLVHLADIARYNGTLRNCTAYAYENNMTEIKRYVKGTGDPIIQIANRLAEKEASDGNQMRVCDKRTSKVVTEWRMADFVFYMKYKGIACYAKSLKWLVLCTTSLVIHGSLEFTKDFYNIMFLKKDSFVSTSHAHTQNVKQLDEITNPMPSFSLLRRKFYV